MTISAGVRQSIPFRMGQNGHIVENMTAAEHREFHGLRLCQLYDELPDFVRADISLFTFSAYDPDVNQTATTLKGLNDPGMRKQMTRIVARTQETTRDSALLVFKDLPTSPAITPEEINGCLEAATWNIPMSVALDPWGYCRNGRLAQSYETCQSSSLFSTTTAINLTGEGVHFMMFQSGRHALQIKRFLFGSSALDSDAAATGNRREVSPQFLANLGLDPSLADGLRVHAIRLDKVQHILNQPGGHWLESHAQLLFQHILNNLLVDILSEGEIPCRVIDVTGMNEMDVKVEVCKEYLNMQNKQQVVEHGRSANLTMKTDLAVESIFQDSAVATGEEELYNAALESKYIIEMKKAGDYLRNGAIRQKSQLIAESLARHLSLVRRGPNVLFSLLTDCCCLHVLVHFREEQRAYLSHREIEPGRMIAVLVWLHKVSHNGDLTEDKFLKCGFEFGQTFESEISDAINRRKRASGSRIVQGNRGSKKTNNRKPGPCDESPTSGRNLGANLTLTSNLLLDVSAADEREKRDAEIKHLATFSAFQNHYVWGCDLPMTEGVLDVVGRTGDERVQEGNGAKRAGFEDSIERMHQYSESNQRLTPGSTGQG